MTIEARAAYLATATKIREREAREEASARADLLAQLEQVAGGPDAAMADRAKAIIARLDDMLAEAGVFRALDMAFIGAYIQTGKNQYGKPVNF